MAEAATSSWLTPNETAGPRPAAPPQPAPLPPNVRRAVPVGGVAEPEPEPFPPAPPTPTALSEADARVRLVELQQAKREAEARSDAAQQALGRAQKHDEACAATLGQFDTLDSDVAAVHVQALRDGDGRHVELSEQLRQRIAERDAAKIAANAAAAAVPVFEREATVARDAVSSARIAVSNCVDGLTARHAVALLGRRNEVAAELEALDAAVLAYEQFAKPVPRRIADFAMERYASGTRVALLSTEQWRSLHSRLTEDAQAALELGHRAA